LASARATWSAPSTALRTAIPLLNRLSGNFVLLKKLRHFVSKSIRLFELLI
jgi:hypothetical protein